MLYTRRYKQRKRHMFKYNPYLLDWTVSDGSGCYEHLFVTALEAGKLKTKVPLLGSDKPVGVLHTADLWMRVHGR